MRTIGFLLPLAILLSTASLGFAQYQVVLEPDRDNTLIENPFGVFSAAIGPVFAGEANLANLYPIKRPVMRFDIEGNIPPGSTIQSVSLAIRVLKRYSGESENRTATLHVLASDWGEGTSTLPAGRGGGGVAATDGDATWLHTFHPDQMWTNPGGDFVATVSGSTVLGDVGSYTFASTPQMVADMQAWVDGASANFGWLMQGAEGDDVWATARRIGSREATSQSSRPKLTIDYTVPDEQLCRWGAVDLGGAGTAQNVLTINGSAGDGGRVVTVPVNGGISVDMVASGSGPSPGNFVLWLWIGEPDATTITPLPKNLGNLCFPMLATGGEPQPLKTWNNIGRFTKLGQPDFPSTPAPSNVLNAPSGTDTPVTATLQGIIFDDGSAADAPASITNAVILKVE